MLFILLAEKLPLFIVPSPPLFLPFDFQLIFPSQYFFISPYFPLRSQKSSNH